LMQEYLPKTATGKIQRAVVGDLVAHLLRK
jgi:acyl-coenzyme A synthetase/AMP-(fatty) acid ligase